MPTALALPMFNPIVFAKRLKDAGVPEPQAEAEAEILHDALAQQAQAVTTLENKFTAFEDKARQDADKARQEAEQMARKGDIALAERALRGDIALVKEELTGEIALVRAEIDLVRAEIALVRAEIERVNATHSSEISLFKEEVKGEFSLVREELKGEFSLVRKEIAIARRDTIIWLGSMMILGFGSVMTMLFRLLK